ncbi:UNVERIFIED_CONTAM: hypothetical protein GTU68_027490 [Idotea baltica]|nr:hypothetical protein [Idotea baltica]
MNSKVPVQLLFFASAKDLVGLSSKEYLLSSSTSSDSILQEVSTDYPDLLKLKGSLIVSVNQEYCDINQSITLVSGDEVAFIPPISGGKLCVLIVRRLTIN